MKSLNFLRDEYDSSQRDLYTETEEIRKKFPDLLTYTELGRIETKGSISRIESGWMSNLQFKIVITTKSDKYQCQIETNGTAEKFAQKIDSFSKAFPDIHLDKGTTSFSWNVDTVDEAMDWWKTFKSSL